MSKRYALAVKLTTEHPGRLGGEPAQYAFQKSPEEPGAGGDGQGRPGLLRVPSCVSPFTPKREKGPTAERSSCGEGCPGSVSFSGFPSGSHPPCSSFRGRRRRGTGSGTGYRGTEHLSNRPETSKHSTLGSVDRRFLRLSLRLRRTRGMSGFRLRQQLPIQFTSTLFLLLEKEETWCRARYRGIGRPSNGSQRSTSNRSTSNRLTYTVPWRRRRGRRRGC